MSKNTSCRLALVFVALIAIGCCVIEEVVCLEEYTPSANRQVLPLDPLVADVDPLPFGSAQSWIQSIGAQDSVWAEPFNRAEKIRIVLRRFLDGEPQQQQQSEFEPLESTRSRLQTRQASSGAQRLSPSEQRLLMQMIGGSGPSSSDSLEQKAAKNNQQLEQIAANSQVTLAASGHKTIRKSEQLLPLRMPPRFGKRSSY